MLTQWPVYLLKNKFNWSQTSEVLETSEVFRVELPDVFLIGHKMELRTKDFNLWYDKSSNIIYFEGSLRLNGDNEYAPVLDLLTKVL